MSITDILSRADGPVAVVVRGGRHRDDGELKSRCRALTAPHYLAFESLFERDWAFSTQGYFVGLSGRLGGFILTANHFVSGVGNTVFLGLSAGDDRQTGHAQTVKAYALALADASSGDPRVDWLWGTTASPIVYLAASSYLSDFAPAQSAQATTAQLCIARRIREDRKMWGWQRSNVDEPFVLRGVSSSVRYSGAESSRLLRMRSKVPIFDELELVEEHGDRLMFIGRPPEARAAQAWVARLLRETRMVEVIA